MPVRIKKGRDVFELAQKDLAKATTMAVNKATASTVVEVKRIIRGKHNIQLKELSPNSPHGIRVVNAKSGSTKTMVSVPHKPLGLIYFSPKISRKQLSVELLRGKRVVLKDSFVLNVSKDARQIFKRYGEKVLPKVVTAKTRRKKDGSLVKRQRIKKRSGLSIAQLFIGRSGASYQKEMQKIFSEKFSKELVRASRYVVGRR